jgi:Mg-chelatase subunit ChlD
MDFENQSTTSPWATRRRVIILGVAVLILTAISFGVFWKFWYKVPTCFDKLQNGDETGVDCGGSCTLVCNSSVIKPIVQWDPRLFEVLPGLWSVLVYVENPNANVDATYVPYSFTIYDENNNVLIKKDGATILPKNKTVGIFEGPLTFKEGVEPKRAIFELGDGIVWNKNEASAPNITISNGPLLQLDSQPKVEADVKNNDIQEIKNIELVIAIFDGSDNAIAASRTFVEDLKKDENANVFFTWPKPFKLGSKVCEKPSDVMLLLDRSGSMAALGSNPSQPLSTAKEAAISFINQLSPKDMVGVISFASQAKNPIDSVLTLDLNSAKQAVESINIEASSTQYTNIYEALHSGWQELVSARSEEGYSKVIILLTDGIANNPKNPQGKTEADDIKYAEDLALKESDSAKKDGLIIYTIGLGNKINESFLKNIASSKDNYFFAPSASNLETIYENISSDICKEMPARIEITYKIFGTLN